MTEDPIEEDAKVDALVKHFPGGACMTALDGSVLFANAAAARLRGLPEIKSLIDSVRAGPQRSQRALVEVRLDPGEGAVSPLFYDCRAFRVERGGRDSGVLVFMSDATAEHGFKLMRDDFFHAVAHDLRGPLTIIDGMVYFMKKIGGLEGRQRKYLDLAEQALRRMSDLVADILDIAKFESGSAELSLSRFPAEAFLAAMRDSCLGAAQAKKISFELESAAAGELEADRQLLERAVMNLVGNAIKFTPAGGRIVLGAAGTEGEVEFYVQDTGPGIPEDKADAVFEKFVKLERDAAPRSGYGLGLSVCKKIVALHGGRIWVESKPGAGSRFIFRVPRRPPHAA